MLELFFVNSDDFPKLRETLAKDLFTKTNFRILKCQDNKSPWILKNFIWFLKFLTLNYFKMFCYTNRNRSAKQRLVAPSIMQYWELPSALKPKWKFNIFSSLFLLTRIQQCFKTNAQMYLQLSETLWGLDKNFKSGNFEMANMRKTSNIFKKRYLSSNKDIYVYLCIHYNIYTHVYLYTYIISYYNMCMCHVYK